MMSWEARSTFFYAGKVICGAFGTPSTVGVPHYSELLYGNTVLPTLDSYILHITGT
jgi:hypothetical protein